MAGFNFVQVFLTFFLKKRVFSVFWALKSLEMKYEVDKQGFSVTEFMLIRP